MDVEIEEMHLDSAKPELRCINDAVARELFNGRINCVGLEFRWRMTEEKKLGGCLDLRHSVKKHRDEAVVVGSVKMALLRQVNVKTLISGDCASAAVEDELKWRRHLRWPSLSSCAVVTVFSCAFFSRYLQLVLKSADLQHAI